MSLPQFDNIEVKNISFQLDQLLKTNKQTIDTLLSQPELSWQSLMQPLEELDDTLHKFWSPISHLHSVLETDALRKQYTDCLQPLTQYSSDIAHNKKLYQAIKNIAENKLFDTDNAEQQASLVHQLRDFKLAGVSLNEQDKKTFVELSQRLSELSNKFSTNVLDATHGWHYQTDDQQLLAGLPTHRLAAAQHAASDKQKTGWLFTLDAPVFIDVMTYADNRELRETFYQAYTTRASDQGPNAGKWDNSANIQAILESRLALAKLLGFDNYADYSLATKMVDSPQQVLDFLQHLATEVKPKAEQDIKELTQFAQEQGHQGTLQPWDIGYYSEKLRQAKYNISDEQLRPYFPAEHVLKGLFAIVHRLYGIRVEANTTLNTWHKDVKTYSLFNASNQHIADCYMDLYAREHKRGGAWMDECQIKRQQQLPAAYLTCNFQAPIGDTPALLTHDDVVTLFHEFGHCLHHMLTEMTVSDVSGINGVAWDAVELPSQFMENWAWQKESMSLIAKHYETGESLPNEYFDRMIAAKNFQSAMSLARQLEFALFDFTLHLNFDPTIDKQVQLTLDQVRDRISVTPRVDYNRFQNSFGHIFAGGYAAGYYSYLWAEVMAADAFSLFEEKGLFDQDTAQRFRSCVLAKGGSEKPAKLFKDFRGRDPDIEALLVQRGIQSTSRV